MNKIIPLTVILLMLMMICLPGASADASSDRPSFLGSNEPLIVSPYNDIDFDAVRQYRAALHTHTTESDGRKSPSESISAHQNAGYDILAITDHWICTQYSGETDMLLINGSEPTHRVHHTISLFTDFAACNDRTYGFEETMQQVASHDGIQLFAHPLNYIESTDRHLYGIDWYLQYFDAYPHLLGMEVSAFSGYESSVASLWDVLLVHYGQSRPIYAFGNSDYHGFFINTSSTYILADSLDTITVKQSIMDGKMFYDSKGYGAVPTIQDIEIDGDTITVSTNGPDIRWINNGAVLGTGHSYTFSGAELSNYVRLEVWNKGSMIGTQAFFLNSTEVTLDCEKPVASAGMDRTLKIDDVLTFDARPSSDNVGLMNYTWNFHDIIDIVLYGPMPSYQFHHPGTYAVTLTVTDTANNIDVTVVEVQVGLSDIPVWIWGLIVALMSIVLAFIIRNANA